MEENLMAGSAIIAIVNAIQMQFPQVKGLWGILIAILLGLGMGYMHLFGVSGLDQGLIIALASSGVYKVASKAGGK
jgi:hypothetical protein